MKASYLTIILVLTCFMGFSQVGINTTTPNAQLDIRSSSQATPLNTDGILIPKIDAFPTSNPGGDQNGMMVFLTTAVGTNAPGFYYWDAPGNIWISVKGKEGGTLDEAYDFGGPGAGNTIIADAGAVTIEGTDGLVSTGSIDVGAIAPSGAGVRMVWNPRKAAFRAGGVSGTVWDDTIMGRYSSAFGFNSRASGDYSTAFGFETIVLGLSSTAFGSNSIASGDYSTAFGHETSASGHNSVAFGNETIASGSNSVSFGNFTIASGTNSVSFGHRTIASEFASTAFGFETTASGEGSTAFGQETLASGLMSTALGLRTTASGSLSTAFGDNSNAIGRVSTAFGKQNNALSYGETVIGIGATIQVPSENGDTQFRAANATDRLFVIGNAIDTNNNDSVSESDRSDAMIVLKNGLTRLPSMDNAMIDAADGKTVVTKEYLQHRFSGTLNEAYNFGGPGAGNTIYADAGAVTIEGWDGLVSTGSIDVGAIAPSGGGTRMVWNPRKAAFRAGSVTGTQWDDVNVGYNSIAFGIGTIASGDYSTAFGTFTTASGVVSTAFGSGTTATAFASTAFGRFTTASGDYSTSFGRSNAAIGDNSTAFGNLNNAQGNYSTTFGRNNTAGSYGETVIGIGATTYTPSNNGATQFRTANATDRLFVIGNAIDANNNGQVEVAERSDAMVVLKNGNIGFGTSTPARRLHVSNGNSGATSNANSAFVLESDGSVYQHFLSPSTTEKGIYFGAETGSIRGGLIYNSVSALEGIQFRTGGNTNRMTLTSAGDLGIGITAPAEKLHVSGPAGLTAVRIANTSGTGSTSNVALDFFRRTNINADWRIYNVGAFLTIANSLDDLETINNLYQFQASRFMPMNDATQNLGQGTLRWNTLFASNGTINTSDVRAKKNIQNLNYGLNALMQLRPVSFEWKKEDGTGTKLGLIAQELQEVIPEVVRDWDWDEDELGNRHKVTAPLLGVYYSDLIPVLVKAAQEQQTIIENQQEEINQLKSELSNMQLKILQRLERLETKN